MHNMNKVMAHLATIPGPAPDMVNLAATLPLGILPEGIPAALSRYFRQPDIPDGESCEWNRGCVLVILL